MVWSSLWPDEMFKNCFLNFVEKNMYFEIKNKWL